MIRWKIVVHAFIDGFSRLVTGIRASNNNWAETVLDLFLDLIEVHGIPSRLRGDHGTENLLVAAWIEEFRGVERGSYIWGRCVLCNTMLRTVVTKFTRSVHNIRIERLWRDFTSGIGMKWKELFQSLEHHDGLDADSDAHIWLLHRLFLSAINQDLLEWAETWNSHTLSIHGERQRSPRDMFVFGMLQNGVRGLDAAQYEPVDEDIDDLSSYGIDWEDYDDHQILSHHHESNGVNQDPTINPFLPHPPTTFSHVEVEEPDCPLTSEQLLIVDNLVEQSYISGRRSIDDYRSLWIAALHVCQQMPLS